MRRYVIPSLIAAGFLPCGSAKALPIIGDPSQNPPEEPTLFEVFKLNHRYTLAGHRSHSSHSSHRSSSGGGYSVPTYPRNLNSTPPSSVLPSPPAAAVPAPEPRAAPAVRSPSSRGSVIDLPAPPSPQKLPAISPPPSASTPPPNDKPLSILPGNSNRFSEIVKQVQTALIAFGYYTGTIDGIVGTEMRVALSKMQSDYKLKVTGTITPEVLDALRIVAR